MKKVITYGTFDLLHQGHVNLLRRAKELGDYLVVGVTSDAYDKERGKINVHDSLLQRVENVKNTGYADEILVEEYEGQKILDIQKLGIDTFAIGSDWVGKFDYLREYCEVVYLERTRGVSSTMLRNERGGVLRMGVIGTGRIAARMNEESKYVSRVNIEAAYNPHIESVSRFATEQELALGTADFDEFLDYVDAVYVATPHPTHADYVRRALEAGKHVLCEKPMCLDGAEAEELFALANAKGLVLMEAVKTAYLPAFEHLVVMAKSGRIGKIRDIDATFTSLRGQGGREWDPAMGGGSVNEFGSYTLLPIIKLLGCDFEDVEFFPTFSGGIDSFCRGVVRYKDATGSFKVGLGVKSEGSLVIAGTAGYVYVPAPWWKTDYFEMRFENPAENRRYYWRFEGDGLRYELMEFAQRCAGEGKSRAGLTQEESVALARVIGSFNKLHINAD